MNSLKKISILSCLIFFLMSSLYCQNLPFRFNNDVRISANKSDVKVNDSVFNSKTFYDDLYKKTSAKGKMLKDSILLKYKNEKEKLIAALNETRELSAIRKLKSSLEICEQDEKAALKSIDEIQNIAEQFRYQALNSRNLRIFPVANAIHAQLFYDSQVADRSSQILKNTNIIYNPEGEKVSVMNEIYADYFGPFRVGFGILISNKDNNINTSADSLSSQKDAMQRLLGGGGNVIGNISYPLIYFSDRNEQINLKGAFSPRIGLDVPALGTSSGEYAYNFDTGFDLSIFYRGSLKTITLFLNSRVGYVTGNKVFFQNLHKVDSKGFFFNQISLGIALNSTFRIAWSGYYGNKYVKDNFASVISFSIIPD